MSDPFEPDDDEAAIRLRLSVATRDHADLDVAIRAMMSEPMPDLMVIGRFKRKKLILKDEIARLRDQLTPDIIA